MSSVAEQAFAGLRGAWTVPLLPLPSSMMADKTDEFEPFTMISPEGRNMAGIMGRLKASKVGRRRVSFPDPMS